MYKKERELFEELSMVTLDIRAYKHRNRKVFDALKKLEEREAALRESLKSAAREHARAGETVVLFDEPIGKVMVVGPLAAARHDLEVARREWPRNVLEQALVLDEKKVAWLVEGEMLDGELAKKAELPREPLTPQVRIEVRG
jgi:hypothetical protein